MPPGIYLSMGLCFAVAITVLASAFQSGIRVPYGIIVAFLVAFFAVPTIFVRTSRARGGNVKALGWFEFLDKGIVTATGRTSAGGATTLVLILPVLILLWAIAVATIAALV